MERISSSPEYGRQFTARTQFLVPQRPLARTVDIGMFDTMRFASAMLKVQRGETIRFQVRNKGQIQHEIVIGSSEEIAHLRHAVMDNPAMVHAAPNMAHVAPGKREQLRWTFDSIGKLEFACLLPGHYQAGMRGTINALGIS